MTRTTPNNAQPKGGPRDPRSTEPRNDPQNPNSAEPKRTRNTPAVRSREVIRETPAVRTEGITWHTVGTGAGPFPLLSDPPRSVSPESFSLGLSALVCLPPVP